MRLIENAPHFPRPLSDDEALRLALKEKLNALDVNYRRFLMSSFLRR